MLNVTFSIDNSKLKIIERLQDHMTYQASLHCREAYYDWTWSEQFKDPDADLMETPEESEDDITDHV